MLLRWNFKIQLFKILLENCCINVEAIPGPLKQHENGSSSRYHEPVFCYSYRIAHNHCLTNVSEVKEKTVVVKVIGESPIVYWNSFLGTIPSISDSVNLGGGSSFLISSQLIQSCWPNDHSLRNSGSSAFGMYCSIWFPSRPARYKS